MLHALLAITLLLAAHEAAAGNYDVHFRAYTRRGSPPAEQNLKETTPSSCMARGQKWLASQPAAEAYFSCGTQCQVRDDGSTLCSNLCEIDRSRKRTCTKDGVVPKP
jgi:hypothetical protein